jgi:protein-disulfide isomerase
MNSMDIESHIKQNIDLARSLDISATPTFVLGDNVIPGAISLEEFQKEIKKERLKK